MKKAILLFVLFIGFVTAKGQFDFLDKVAHDDDGTLKTAAKAKGLSKEEKMIFLIINIARTNPGEFKSKFVTPYLATFNIPESDYTNSLQKELMEMQKLETIDPHEALQDEAAYVAKNLGKKGYVGNVVNEGETFEQRVSELENRFYYLAESSVYGQSAAIHIVMDLLINEGVEETPNRQAVLDPQARFLGVSIKPHKNLEYVCVQEFGGSEK